MAGHGGNTGTAAPNKCAMADNITRPLAMRLFAAAMNLARFLRFGRSRPPFLEFGRHIVPVPCQFLVQLSCLRVLRLARPLLTHLSVPAIFFCESHARQTRSLQNSCCACRWSVNFRSGPKAVLAPGAARPQTWRNRDPSESLDFGSGV